MTVHFTKIYQITYQSLFSPVIRMQRWVGKVKINGGRSVVTRIWTHYIWFLDQPSTGQIYMIKMLLD